MNATTTTEIEFVLKENVLYKVHRHVYDAMVRQSLLLQEMEADKDKDDELAIKMRVPLPMISARNMDDVVQFVLLDVYDMVIKAPIVSSDVMQSIEGLDKERMTRLSEFIHKIIPTQVSDQDRFFELAHAGKYLQMNTLVDFMCATIASTIKDLTTDQIRALYHITPPTDENDPQTVADRELIFDAISDTVPSADASHESSATVSRSD